MLADPTGAQALLDTQMIYTIFGALCTAIVAMAAGFIYVYRKMESKLSETEELLIKYIKQYTQTEALYVELKSDHKALLREHKDMLQDTFRR